mmetsp:Transcript_119134/g.273238  ORF Transcript_119134/g.273238 Transcript_119134/m.273238 type:complete len:333 (-) Transcript_119134:149-1147(-)
MAGASKISKDANDPTNFRKAAPQDFTWSSSPEPHAVRRREILKAHPEVKTLYGPDNLSGVMCVATVLLQFFVAYQVKDWSAFPLFLVTYCISATCNQSLFLAMHELSHDMFFHTKWLNGACGYFSNLPSGVAAFGTFKRYHLEHHSSQGVDVLDVDIPTQLEGKLFRTWYLKLVWVILQPVWYSFRPMITLPKSMNRQEAMGWVLAISCDLLVYHFWGLKALLYLFGGAVLGSGLHPMAGHFIAEHFEFIEGQETYSYYGWMNYLIYNVGYHNEHHDFPMIPGRRLPQLKAMAPEYYDMPSYSSYWKVLYHFIFVAEMNPFCRVKRESAKGK